MQKTLLKGIDFYRREISPRKRACCRFQPTCSEYAKIAIERYGAAQGACLALKRL
ncbi:MAG: membrane protein insertion efficiency factor YidD, partial [Clostridia bacterium]|nr:membrane protein insertion efficiency factor YidD [Clostridia bacterium]